MRPNSKHIHIFVRLGIFCHPNLNFIVYAHGRRQLLEFGWDKEVNPLLTHNAPLTLCLLSTNKNKELAGALNRIEKYLLEHLHIDGILYPHAPFQQITITKTYLYNFDSLKPHFYIVKLGFTWVDIIFSARRF